MSYTPLYSQPSTVPSNSSSIWSPSQHQKPVSSYSSWSCMPTANIGPRLSDFYNESLTTTKTLVSNPSLALLDDRNCRPVDVFGPVMSNDLRSPYSSAQAKRNVGAVGDRRTRPDFKQHSIMSESQDPSDSCSAFAVGQLLRTLEFSPTLPSEPFLSQLKSSSGKSSQAAFSQSPSASSNASSPGVLDILQTPSDTSPLAHRLPHMPEFLPDQLRYRSNIVKPSTPFTFESHSAVQRTLHGLPGKPHMYPTTKTHSSAPRFSTPVYDLSSIPSSGGVFPNSYPLNDSTPSTSIYATSQASTAPYQGIFNPFDNNINAGIGPTRYLDDSTSPHEDFSKSIRRQGGGLSDNLIWPQSITSSLDYNYHVPPSSSSPSPRPPASQRRQPDPTLGTLNNLGFSATQIESKTIPPFPTSQPMFDVSLQQLERRQTSPHVSPHVSGTNTQESDFVTCDMLRNLAIAGFNRQREKQRPVSGTSVAEEHATQPSLGYCNPSPPESSSNSPSSEKQSNEPINFLHLLSPTAVPPYSHFVTRIIKSSDQQASIFLQQKLKIADASERKKIVDAVSQRGVEMMTNRFGNWAVQRCLEPPCELADRMKIIQCMKGHVVELATNCYGTHVLQKALDCEEDIRLLVVSELLLGDPSSTLLNKHSAHVWSKIMELTWTPPAPPIFAYVNKSLAGKWASLACHETGSLVVQTAFEQCEEADNELIIGELLDEEAFSEVVTNAWGNFCILHLLEHGAPHHRVRAIDNLIKGLSQYASHEQSIKCVLKALKEGGPEILDKVVARLCEPPKGGRRPSLVDISLSPIGSQLVGTILPNVNKEQRSALYEAIRGHVVTLRGSRVGSKVIWLFDRMRAYYGY